MTLDKHHIYVLLFYFSYSSPSTVHVWSCGTFGISGPSYLPKIQLYLSKNKQTSKFSPGEKSNETYFP